MSIKLTPELLRLLNQEEETKDELKQARAELVREKIKTEKERRAKLSESRKPKAETSPKPSRADVMMFFGIIAATLADVIAALLLLFMF